MGSDSAIWLGAFLLFGGIWLTWGRRAAGLAMLSTLGLAALGMAAVLGLGWWTRFQEQQALEAQRQEAEEAAALREKELSNLRSSCTTQGGTWWEAYGVCESAEETAARKAREAEEEQQRLAAVAEQERIRRIAEAESERISKLRTLFERFRENKERKALIAHGGSEFEAFRAIANSVSSKCGELGGTPREDLDGRVNCDF